MREKEAAQKRWAEERVQEVEEYSKERESQLEERVRLLENQLKEVRERWNREREELI